MLDADLLGVVLQVMQWESCRRLWRASSRKLAADLRRVAICSMRLRAVTLVAGSHGSRSGGGGALTVTKRQAGSRLLADFLFREPMQLLYSQFLSFAQMLFIRGYSWNMDLYRKLHSTDCWNSGVFSLVIMTLRSCFVLLVDPNTDFRRHLIARQSFRAWWLEASQPVFAGGRIRARVVSKGLHLPYPDTRINVWGRNLHAPMAERVLELPIDVYDGRALQLVWPISKARQAAKQVFAEFDPATCYLKSFEVTVWAAFSAQGAVGVHEAHEMGRIGLWMHHQGQPLSALFGSGIAACDNLFSTRRPLQRGAENARI